MKYKLYDQSIKAFRDLRPGERIACEYCINGDICKSKGTVGLHLLKPSCLMPIGSVRVSEEKHI